MSREPRFALVLAALLLAAPACITDADDAGLDGEDPTALGDGKADGVSYVQIGTLETYFKKIIVDASGRPVQAASLQPGTQKCTVAPGTRVELKAGATIDGNHVRVTPATRLPGCEFDTGYFYIPHIAKTNLSVLGGGVTGGCAAPVSASACALLGTLAYSEGTDNHYNYTFGYQTFSSYADHPRRVVCSGGYCSDAAGRYQFLSTTWDGVRYGLPDFGPASQDRAAIRLIQNRGVANIDGIDTYAEFTSAIYRLNGEWASLPGSPYGQPTRSMSSLWAKFRALRGI